MRLKSNTVSVLLLEGDARRLAEQGIDVAGRLKAGLDIMNLGLKVFGVKLEARVKHVRVQSEAQLAQELARYTGGGGHSHVVVLAGHSDDRVVRLFETRRTRWPEVGSWLKALAPDRLVLVGCEAGEWLPCQALFEGVPSLQVILGSPVKHNVTQAAPELFVPALVLGLSREALLAIQAVTFWNTNGVVLCRTRDEFEGDPSDRVLSRAIDEVIKAVASARAAPAGGRSPGRGRAVRR